ncbi:hypothetical protein [Micromonospora noduli]|nr:hypothetical protein [Micromonospora noduli]
MSQTAEWDRVVEGARVHFMAGQDDEPETADKSMRTCALLSPARRT